MKIAIVTLATNDYIVGAENLFYSIYKNIDERNIDFYYATDI
jgi:lipopolysaccharide biosynthesis glycosyltransferase